MYPRVVKWNSHGKQHQEEREKERKREREPVVSKQKEKKCKSRKNCKTRRIYQRKWSERKRPSSRAELPKSLSLFLFHFVSLSLSLSLLSHSLTQHISSHSIKYTPKLMQHLLIVREKKDWLREKVSLAKKPSFRLTHMRWSAITITINYVFYCNSRHIQAHPSNR